MAENFDGSSTLPAVIGSAALITFTLGFTTPSSIIRLAVLPILLVFAYIILNDSKYLARKAYAETIGSFGTAFAFQYIETGLLSKWSYETQGPTFPNDKEAPHNYGKARREYKGLLEDSFLGRLKFGWTSFVSTRQAGTPYQAKGVPSFSSSDPNYIPTRKAFIIKNTLLFCASYLIMDFIESQPQPPNVAEMFNPSKAPILPPVSRATLEDVIFKIVSSAVTWTITYTLLVCLYYSVALPAVALGLSSPSSWPPWNDSISETYTVRGFWGKFWHQGTRRLFSNPSIYFTDHVLRLPPGILSRYTKIFLTFFLSGTFHLLADNASGTPILASGALKFFMLQAVGILLEDSIQALWRMISGEKVAKERDSVLVWKKVVGWCWMVFFLLFWTSPIWFWPKIATSTGSKSERITPISLFDIILKR